MTEAGEIGGELHSAFEEMQDKIQHLSEKVAELTNENESLLERVKYTEVDLDLSQRRQRLLNARIEGMEYMAEAFGSWNKKGKK